jgi:hypothetical protein
MHSKSCITLGGSSLRTSSFVRRRMNGAILRLRDLSAVMNYSVSSSFSCIFLMLPVKYLLYILLNVVSSSRKSGMMKSKSDHSSETRF